MTEKKLYMKPVLEYCGPVSARTLGHGGYTLDGTGAYDQQGSGNDDKVPK